MSIQTTMKASTATWYVRAARFGLSAKGIVYCISGFIAVLVALDLAGQSTKDAGKKQIFRQVAEAPMGKFLLIILVLGLACYTLWRWLQAFKDTDHKGKDGPGLAKRLSYLSSGFIYASVTVYAAKVLIGNSGSNGDARQNLVSTLLDQPYGRWLVGIVAAIMIGTGLYQIYRAISGKYKKYVRDALAKDVAPWIITAGVAGYIARGVVWLIIGWLFIKAAMHANPREVGGTDRVFSWLRDSAYGSWLLGAVAAGLVCYGLFMFLRARYQHINTR
jgi:hypothetical protein